jgi:hypothetical protein
VPGVLPFPFPRSSAEELVGGNAVHLVGDTEAEILYKAAFPDGDGWCFIDVRL